MTIPPQLICQVKALECLAAAMTSLEQWCLPKDEESVSADDLEDQSCVLGHGVYINYFQVIELRVPSYHRARGQLMLPQRTYLSLSLSIFL
jgi:hypothetical protein